MGSDPQMHIEGPEEDGVRMVCKASGWFPKPQVQWRDLSGNKFPALSEAHTQDTEELFSVEATLVVRDSSVGNVTCSVLNPVLGQEKAMAIYIPEPFFPQASPWEPAFAVILTMLGLLLLGSGMALASHGSPLVRRGSSSPEAQLWRVSAPPGKVWTRPAMPLGPTDAGVGGSGPLDFISHGKIPARVGVFLDYSEGDVSFYNLMDGFHIFSFPPVSFCGTLFPYFMFMYGDVSMTICSMESLRGSLYSLTIHFL
nr:butyrophilin subfamily 1 member A1-like [Marmota flaviventris]